MTEPISVTTALESLDRLKQAAPPTTASRLGQIIALIQSLAADNAYLSAQIVEDASLLDALPLPEPDELPPPPPPPEPEPEIVDTAIADNLTLDIIAGLNDALRAPLDAIRGRAELIQAELSDTLTEEQSQWVQVIDDNTNQAFLALDAVERLISLIRQKININWANIIATELLEAAQNRVLERATQSHHEIITQIPEVVPLAYGDFEQSLVILTDLMDNAIRYTPPGGHIRVSVDNLGTHVLFSVSDDGIGLDSEAVANVSNPFWRGTHHPLVQFNASGTGLSLFLAKHILALQDGELIFSGEPDLGSTFSFTLPTPA